ncbi:MAG TPA: hypothetical protein VFY65_16770 [Longimicrobium sp.]|nr:hypothetical protein [Longimicrobium sp.]
MAHVPRNACAALLIALAAAGCADEATGPAQRAAANDDAPSLSMGGASVKFYAWTDEARFIGNSNGIGLTFHAPYDVSAPVYDARLDRQFVPIAKTCDRAGGWTPRNAWFDQNLVSFAIANADKHFTYIVGDEPDVPVRDGQNNVICPALTPEQYAAVFHDIRQYFHGSVDGTARFEPAGLGFSGEFLSGTAYAQQFYDKHVQNYGSAPAVAAWRSNIFSTTAHPDHLATWETAVNQANAWAVAKGSPWVLGSFGIPNIPPWYYNGGEHWGPVAEAMPRMFAHVRSQSNVIAAAWWRFERVPLTPCPDCMHPLVENDTLTATGKKFRELTGPALSAPYVQYLSHVADQGWDGSYRQDRAMSGTTGLARDMQAVKIRLGPSLQAAGVGVCYDTYLRAQGWQGERCNDAEAGTTGQARPMLGLKVRLTNPRPGMRICYRAHIGYIGDTAPVCDNQQVGTLYDDGISYYQDIQAIWIWVEGV